MTAAAAETGPGERRESSAPATLTLLAQEYPEHSMEELAHVVDQAAQVAAILYRWTADVGDYTLTLARDRLNARRARQIALGREGRR